MCQRGHAAPPATNQSSSDPVNSDLQLGNETQTATRSFHSRSSACSRFIAGMAVAGGSDERDSVARFGAAWAAGDIDAMYAELNPASQSQVLGRRPAGRLRARGDDGHGHEPSRSATRAGRSTRTAPTSSPCRPRSRPPPSARSAARSPSRSPTVGSAGSPTWSFPASARATSSISETKVPKRAPILAADRTPLAQGPAGARTTSGSGGIVTGETSEPPPERQQEMKAAGFPKGTPAGTSGLELAFDEVLSGTPGGKLFASGDDGRTLIARRAPDPRRAGADDDRRRPAGRHGGGARQHLRRRRRAQRARTATCSRSPARPSRPSSRPARRSR